MRSMKTLDTNQSHIGALDGWRGISILLVLAGHLFPLGPQFLQLNGAVAATGMVIFFNLSGFLIASLLLRDSNIRNFLIKRLFRIVPIAWLAMLVTFVLSDVGARSIIRNLTFTANIEPMALERGGEHLWSLCVEVQFYVAIAMAVALAGKKALWAIPVVAIAVTALRVVAEVPMAINTIYRVDEILAGSILALVYHHRREVLGRLVKRINPLYLFPLLVFSAHPQSEYLNYFRPYLSALMLASTLFYLPDHRIEKILTSRVLRYIATVSYALYVIHGCLSISWLDHGETKIEKYLKRPLLLAVTFSLAHLSTFYFEKYWINLGRRLTNRGPRTPHAQASSE